MVKCWHNLVTYIVKCFFYFWEAKYELWWPCIRYSSYTFFWEFLLNCVVPLHEWHSWNSHQVSRYKTSVQIGHLISDNSNVDFGIVIVNALFLQVSFRKMKVLTSHGCDGSSYHWDESWNCSLFHEFATCLLKCPNLYTTLTIDLSRNH